MNLGLIAGNGIFGKGTTSVVPLKSQIDVGFSP